MKSPQKLKSEECLREYDNYVDILMQYSDKVLSRKLSTIRKQIEIAWYKKATDALEFLRIMENLIIDARYLKNDFDDDYDYPKRKTKKTNTKKTKVKKSVSENDLENIEEPDEEIMQENVQPEVVQLSLFDNEFSKL